MSICPNPMPKCPFAPSPGLSRQPSPPHPTNTPQWCTWCLQQHYKFLPADFFLLPAVSFYITWCILLRKSKGVFGEWKISMQLDSMKRSISMLTCIKMSQVTGFKLLMNLGFLNHRQFGGSEVFYHGTPLAVICLTNYARGVSIQ